MTKRYLEELVDRIAAEVRPIWVQERNQHLIALDIAWARTRRGLEGLDDLTLIAIMHKARYNIPSIPEMERHVSGVWLRQRGLSDFDGAALLPPGQLPEGPDR